MVGTSPWVGMIAVLVNPSLPIQAAKPMALRVSAATSCLGRVLLIARTDPAWQRCALRSRPPHVDRGGAETRHSPQGPALQPAHRPTPASSPTPARLRRRYRRRPPSSCCLPRRPLPRRSALYDWPCHQRPLMTE